MPLPPSFFCQSSWELIPSRMNEARIRFAIVGDSFSKTKKFIVLGGFQPIVGARPVSSCESFDVRTETWEQLPDMPTPRANLAGIRNGSTLFAMGGSNPNDGTIGTVVAFSNGSWQDLPPMITKRSSFSAALVENKIIVVGGLSDHYREVQAVEEFDPNTQTWTPLPEMLQRRFNHLMTAVKSTVYVFGGWGGLNFLDTAECYDSITRRWESLPNMPRERDCGTAVAVGQYIFLIGGVAEGESALDSVDCFDTVSRQWLDPGVSLAIARKDCGAVLVDNQVFVVGGQGNIGENITTMEKIGINPYYIILPSLTPFLEQENDVPLGLWPHVLAGCSAPSAIYFVLSSDKFLLASVLLH